MLSSTTTVRGFFSGVAACLLAAFALGAATLPAPAAAQLAPPTAGGTAELDHLLQQIAEPRRVLMIAAHPDDEDTTVLTYAARALGAQTAYLSLNRGEGGQNAIGDELGVPLGLIRSRELEAARSVDGAHQFFTRANDFGYTRSLDETDRYWPRELILEDVVRVVRRFRPHVIVSVFTGTTRDGHGHHQMAGVLAHEAFELAGGPDAFPDLAAGEGLEPWTPLKLYRSTRFDPGSSTLTLPVGQIDPRTGDTYFQIAMESRSQHLSQGFGAARPTGPRTANLALVESRVPGPDTALFAGISREDEAAALLADSIRALVPAGRPDAALPGLVRLAETAPPSDPLRADALSRALLLAGGVVVDAIASASEVIPGEAVEVEVTVYNGGARPVAVESLGLMAAPGWEVDPGPDAAAEIAPGSALTRRLTATARPDARPTQPYFLERTPEEASYDWTEASAGLRGTPFDPPPLRVSSEIRVHGALARSVREATYRQVDPTVGETRLPLRVVPAIEVRLSPERLVWSSEDDRARTFTVELEYNGADAVSGEVVLEFDGWGGQSAESFRFERRGETVALAFGVTRPTQIAGGEATVRAVARTDDGREFREAVEVVAYPHIRPTPRVIAAETRIHVAPLVLPELDGVGYVRGVADRVPQALEALGLPLTILDEEALARGDLSRFDVIVVGSRAYESDPALARHNDRLLQYVRDGGHLVVQYQQYGFVQGGYAPYPLEIARPHDRITDYASPVRVLAPDHAVFQAPHAIGPEDWEGWPQERGLYFASTWDERYRPLLEMQDPDLPPVRGGLLVTELGEGTYVYTGISFFRALPAAAPGPTRLFLNLLSLGANGGGAP